ncbi:ribosomal RNA-processing protein 8-like [Aphidius gifuensis]|nr:ribosomal RNA-processing protein 8-like [Aphidius gifuensis]
MNIVKTKKKKNKKSKRQQINTQDKSTTTNSNDKVEQNDNAIVDNKNQLDLNKIQKLLAQKKSMSKEKKEKTMSLRERMLEQLRSARFRYLNETLYNNNSSDSKKLFVEDPDAFEAYHSGYRQQVKQWPLNPLEIIINTIKKMPKEYVVADFGCGDAKLCESVEQKVHSLDLVAVNDKVTACDMAHTSLLTSSVHVVVFCLSLMGKNLADYLLEANRVLKQDGILKIADVESRFENIQEFVKSLEKYGFQNTYQDLSNNLFYFMDFKKIEDVNRRNKNLPQVYLKTCLYKRR